MKAIDGTRPLPGMAAAMVEHERSRSSARSETPRAAVFRVGIGSKIVVCAPTNLLAGRRWLLNGDVRDGRLLLRMDESANHGSHAYKGTTTEGRVGLSKTSLAEGDPMLDLSFTLITAQRVTRTDTGYEIVVDYANAPPPQKGRSGPRPGKANSAKADDGTVSTEQFRKALATVNAFYSQNEGTIEFKVDGGRVRATIMQEF